MVERDQGTEKLERILNNVNSTLLTILQTLRGLDTTPTQELEKPRQTGTNQTQTVRIEGMVGTYVTNLQDVHPVEATNLANPHPVTVTNTPLPVTPLPPSRYYIPIDGISAPPNGGVIGLVGAQPGKRIVVVGHWIQKEDGLMSYYRFKSDTTNLTGQITAPIFANADSGGLFATPVEGPLQIELNGTTLDGYIAYELRD